MRHILPPLMVRRAFGLCAAVLLALHVSWSQGAYYASIDTGSATFVADLHALINPHTKLSYSITVVADIAARDTTNGQKVVDCVYSGHRQVYTPPWSWGTFSREHTWCHSWMPTYSSESGPEYSDLHHLFPTHQNNANGRRSNHPLGLVVNVTYQYLDGKLGTNASGHVVYEPRHQQKGDAARALFYLATAYHGVNGKDWSFGYLNTVTLPALSEAPQDVELLRQWHLQDPPDDWERARNESVFVRQQNRNPYVDHPEYVDVIDFLTMTKRSGGTTDTSGSGGGTGGGGSTAPGGPPEGMAVVVNEYVNGASAASEWVELLVLQDSVDLRGLRLRDHSSAGNAQPSVVFANVPAWQAVARGTLIVLLGGGNTTAQDTSFADRVVTVSVTNAAYFSSGSVTFDISGTTDALQVLTAGGTHVHSLGHGSAIATIPGPNVNVAGSSTAGNAVRFINVADSLAFMTAGSAEHSATSTRGQPNDVVQALYITQLAMHGGTSDVGEVGSSGLPLRLSLAEAYPNPFNPSTTLEFSSRVTGPAMLIVYNVIGQPVGTLFEGMVEAGRRYRAVWEAGSAPSGVYVALLSSAGVARARTMMLVR